MKSQLAGVIVSLVLLGSTVASCVVPGIGPAPSPTPLPVQPTDTLSFTIPAYTATLEPGDTVPGTGLRYIRRTVDAYEVSIDDLVAKKRTGDSFVWDGVLAPGVHASYNLRLTTAIFGRLPVAGPVRVTVFYPQPVEETIPADITAEFSFGNAVVNDWVPTGHDVPGTTLAYQGVVTQGEGDEAIRMAQLSGLGEYPYLALGDSLVWSGQLRDNVLVSYSLRVVAISEDGLRVAGTARLWINPDAR